MRGSFVVSRWNGFNYDLALIPENSDELFDLNRDLTNVLIYMDENDIEGKNLNMFLALGLAKDSEFNVAITTNEDAIVAYEADVVINLFDAPSKKFLNELNKYDDGLRYFVSDSEFNQINSSDAFISFIDRLKNEPVVRVRVGGRLG